MRTGHKGDISEVMVLSILLKAGKEVAIPYGNRPGYDLLVMGRRGSWRRIQVKTAYYRGVRAKRTYVDFLRGSGKGKRRVYEETDFDFLIAMHQDTGEYWVFPVHEVIGKRCVTVDSTHMAWGNLGII